MADFENIIKNYCGEDGSIPAEAIAKLTKAISTTVGNEFVEKTRYKAKLEEIDTLKAEKQTAEDSVTTAEKWQEKYKALKADFDGYKNEVIAKETRSAKENALRKLIDKIGIKKHVDGIVKLTDVDAIALDENDNIVDADKLEQSIKDEWGEYIPTEVLRGTVPETPPTTSGGGKAAFDAMSLSERMKFANEHPAEAAEYMA